MYGLGLGEEEGVFPARGLPRFQPLHAGGLRRSAIFDRDGGGVFRQLDRKRRAQVIVLFAQGEFHRLRLPTVAGTDGFDFQAAGVENQRPVFVVQALEFQPGLALQHLALEIDSEVQIQVLYSIVFGIGEGVVVDARLRGVFLRGEFRDGFLVGFRLLGGGTFRVCLRLGGRFGFFAQPPAMARARAPMNKLVRNMRGNMGGSRYSVYWIAGKDTGEDGTIQVFGGCA